MDAKSATTAPHGPHLIAGAWVGAEGSFTSDPATGPAFAYAVGTAALVDRASRAAEETFEIYAHVSRDDRAASLIDIADQIEARAEAITAIGTSDSGDSDLARRLLRILKRNAGRVLVNGFPTGVEVADAMVHGGPYPASTNFGATSVGTMSIRRFLRPVCYQNVPSNLLSADPA